MRWVLIIENEPLHGTVMIMQLVKPTSLGKLWSYGTKIKITHRSNFLKWITLPPNKKEFIKARWDVYPADGIISFENCKGITGSRNMLLFQLQSGSHLWCVHNETRLSILNNTGPQFSCKIIDKLLSKWILPNHKQPSP